MATTNSPENVQNDNSAEKRYELTNHLGNVLAVVSGEKKGSSAQILSLTDYYPFGMEMDGRKYEKDGDYMYGFTGHEKEFDMANDVYTTDFRLLDARVGRWLSVDPMFKKYAGISSYNYCAGNPVVMVDPDGRENVYSYANIPENRINICKAKNYKTHEHMIDFHAHGNLWYMSTADSTADGKRIDTGKAFDDFLSVNSTEWKNRKALEPKDRQFISIMLHSCETGKEQFNIACKISIYFEDVPIIAPTTKVQCWGEEENKEVVRCQEVGAYDWYWDIDYNPFTNKVGLAEEGKWNIYYNGYTIGSYSNKDIKELVENPEKLKETILNELKKIIQKNDKQNE